MNFNLAEIFARAAEIAGTKTDAGLAEALGITRQTLATWKHRGKIPFEELCELAQGRGVSLDYILLGKREVRTRINLPIFKEILSALASEYSDYRNLAPQGLGKAATLYNNFADVDDVEARRRKILTELLSESHSNAQRDARFFSEKTSDLPHAQEKFKELQKRASKMEEILHDDKKFRIAINNVWGTFATGVSEGESKGVRGSSIATAAVVTQDDRGREHKITGRRVVPKSKKRKK